MELPLLALLGLFLLPIFSVTIWGFSAARIPVAQSRSLNASSLSERRGNVSLFA